MPRKGYISMNSFLVGSIFCSLPRVNAPVRKSMSTSVNSFSRGSVIYYFTMANTRYFTCQGEISYWEELSVAEARPRMAITLTLPLSLQCIFHQSRANRLYCNILKFRLRGKINLFMMFCFKRNGQAFIVM